MSDPTARTGRGFAGRRINLVKLAEAQRWLIWCILARVFTDPILYFASALTVSVSPGQTGPNPAALLGLALQFLAFGAILVSVILVARMARAYGFNWFLAIAGATLLVAPCLGFLLLALLNQRVTATLRRAGARVGFLGVGATEMLKLREGVCAGCGYDIRGLAAPVCPECGRPIAPAPA